MGTVLSNFSAVVARAAKPRGASAFVRDRDGVVSIIFALSVIPILGMVGAATDFQALAGERQRLQSAFDAAAIAGALTAARNPSQATNEANKALRSNLPPGSDTTRIRVEAGTTNGRPSVTIATEGQTIPTTFLRAINMASLNVNVRATAIAQTNTTVTSRPPEVAQLDPEAGDYNRVYVYCFDKNRINQPDQGRTQMTAISDNAGTRFNYTMPLCKQNETMSYRLMNVRNARTQPSKWDTSPPGTLYPTSSRPNEWGENVTFNYFSDTEMVNGVPRFNFANNVPILETVMCNSMAECKPQSQGGVLPEGRNRTAQTLNQACAPGKFIYYGWEDRPPGYGWTDRDYDDIRVIVECPRVDTTTSITVRLVE